MFISTIFFSNLSFLHLSSFFFKSFVVYRIFFPFVPLPKRDRYFTIYFLMVLKCHFGNKINPHVHWAYFWTIIYSLYMNSICIDLCIEYVYTYKPILESALPYIINNFYSRHIKIYAYISINLSRISSFSSIVQIEGYWMWVLKVSAIASFMESFLELIIS